MKKLTDEIGLIWEVDQTYVGAGVSAIEGGRIPPATPQIGFRPAVKPTLRYSIASAKDLDNCSDQELLRLLNAAILDHLPNTFLYNPDFLLLP